MYRKHKSYRSAPVAFLCATAENCLLTHRRALLGITADGITLMTLGWQGRM
ncbi:hypothetical protein OM427_19635 [Halomonas sp. 18H]|nr:hypothetical protein [Halomonas sp. 18H]MCW4151732.1 hypothetical protein [Halomonas sp. 18H]